MFDNIEAAEFMPNYDGRNKEPVVLPAKMPNTLLNGTEGIAVGISAGIPPHNLRELSKAMVALVKNPKLSAKNLMKRMPGPDYGSGVCTSSQGDILSLYESGKGSLQFRCAYHFETDKKDKGVKLLVLDSLAPRFTHTGVKKRTKNSFMDKCSALADSGAIEYVSDESTNNLRIVVGFRDSQVLRDEVLPLLETRIGYQFYAVTRSSEEDKVDKTSLSVQPYNVKSLLLDFINFRRDVERDQLLIDKEKQEAKLSREEATLIAINNIQKITNLQKTAKSAESFISSLKVSLKITMEQAEFIARTPIVNIIKGNKKAQKDKILELTNRLKEINSDLSHIDSVVVRTFKKVAKDFGDDRGMELTSKVPRMPSVEDSKFVSLDSSLAVERHDDYPTRIRRKFKNFIPAGSVVAIVKSDGDVIQRKSTLVSAKSTIKNAVGIVGGDISKLVVADVGGHFGVVDFPQKANEYTAASKIKVDFCAGMGKEDVLLVSIAEGATTIHYPFAFDEVKPKRRNSAPQELVKDVDEVLALSVVSDGDIIVGSNGKRIPMTKKPIRKSNHIFVVGERNLVEYEGGVKEFLDQNDTAKAIRGGQVCKVFRV